MKQVKRQRLWQQLQQTGLADGELPAAKVSESPWFVRVMLGVAGWIGSLFLLGFVAVAFSMVLENGAAALLVGSLICCGAYALFKSNPASDFVIQFGLAIGLVGQMLLIYGLAELIHLKGNAFYAAIFVIEIVLTLLIPNFIYRTLSSLAGAVALTLFFSRFGVYQLAVALLTAGFALLWLQEVRWLRFSAICRPAGYGLALALLLYSGGMVWGRGLGLGLWPYHTNGDSLIAIYSPWVGKGLISVIFLVATFTLLKRLQLFANGPTGLTAMGIALFLTAVSFPVPGLTPALLILIVGFATCNRVLLGLGLLASGAFFSNYYYLLHSTLLVKSILLCSLGVLLLVGRLALRKRLMQNMIGGRADA